MRGCGFEWWDPYHMILCYSVRVCMWEREISTWTILYDGMTLAIFTVIQNLISFRYELFVIYTHARIEKSPVYYFLPILSKMFPSFFHYFLLAVRLGAVFFFSYRFTLGLKPDWVRYITSFHFSRIFVHRLSQLCTVVGLYLNRGWMLFVTLQSVFTLFPYFLLLLQFLFTSVSHDWCWPFEISFCV